MMTVKTIIHTCPVKDPHTEWVDQDQIVNLIPVNLLKPLVIRHFFARIFCPFSIQLHSTFLTPPFSLMLILVMLFPLCLSRSQTDNKNKFDWYNRTPNNSSTGLLTFQNSPVVVPPHPDPALEPLLPPLNTPTTQSSRLPGHGA